MSPSVPKRKKPYYVLVIEDNVHHAELITEVLDRHFAPVIIHTVDQVEDAIEFAGQSEYHLVITAGVVNDAPVADAIPKLSRLTGGVPIVVISGKGDEQLAADFIRAGAAEYLSKTQETLENLATLLKRHLSNRSPKKRTTAKTKKGAEGKPSSPAAIIREVDKLTQQALLIAPSRRRKRRSIPQEIEQLDQLLSQIQKLRELATKLSSKE